MTNELQRKRDAENGVYDVEHKFDPIKGKIIETGKVLREIDPGILQTNFPNLEEHFQKMVLRKKQIESELASLPEINEEELENHLRLTKMVQAFSNKQKLEVELESLVKQVPVLEADIQEEKRLLKDFVDWKASHKEEKK